MVCIYKYENFSDFDECNYSQKLLSETQDEIQPHNKAENLHHPKYQPAFLWVSAKIFLVKLSACTYVCKSRAACLTFWSYHCIMFFLSLLSIDQKGRAPRVSLNNFKGRNLSYLSFWILEKTHIIAALHVRTNGVTNSRSAESNFDSRSAESNFASCSAESNFASRMQNRFLLHHFRVKLMPWNCIHAAQNQNLILRCANASPSHEDHSK